MILFLSKVSFALSFVLEAVVPLLRKPDKNLAGTHEIEKTEDHLKLSMNLRISVFSLSY
jgi:hypothetical protein